MAVLINDLFDFFWLHTVPGNMLDVVVVPLRLQLPELHRLRVAQGTVGFDSSRHYDFRVERLTPQLVTRVSLWEARAAQCTLAFTTRSEVSYEER